MKIAVVIVAALALAGCAEKRISELSYPELKALGLKLQQRCIKEAGPVGTPAHETCMKQYAAQENTRREYSGFRFEPSGALSPAVPPYRPTHCTSYRVGTSINTSCN